MGVSRGGQGEAQVFVTTGLVIVVIFLRDTYSSQQVAPSAPALRFRAD